MLDLELADYHCALESGNGYVELLSLSGLWWVKAQWIDGLMFQIQWHCHMLFCGASGKEIGGF